MLEAYFHRAFFGPLEQHFHCLAEQTCRFIGVFEITKAFFLSAMMPVEAQLVHRTLKYIQHIGQGTAQQVLDSSEQGGVTFKGSPLL